MRVARAIEHELFHQRNGFMAPVDAFTDPTKAALELGAIAILAADNESAELDALRSMRDMWLKLLLEAPQVAGHVTG